MALTWTKRVPARPPAGATAARATADDALDRLLVLVAGGDEGAFAELYRRVAPTVLGLVGKVVRNPAQAEEVTQEVFIDLAERVAVRPGPGEGKVLGHDLGPPAGGRPGPLGRAGGQARRPGRPARPGPPL